MGGWPGQAVSRQQGGPDAAVSPRARVDPFDVAAGLGEFGGTGGVPARDADGVGDVVWVEAEHLGRDGRGAEDAEDAGLVEASGEHPFHASFADPGDDFAGEGHTWPPAHCPDCPVERRQWRALRAAQRRLVCGRLLRSHNHGVADCLSAGGLPPQTMSGVRALAHGVLLLLLGMLDRLTRGRADER